jgi:hypothetical protein
MEQRMHTLPDHETKRLLALLHEHSLDAHRDAILREARPAISLFVDEVMERDRRVPMDGYPLGTSRFGGWPDLPAGMECPAENNEPLTFILQLALSSLPVLSDSPLPSSGMLWLFHGRDSQDELKARIFWRDCEPSKCVRRKPAAAPDAIDFREYDPFGIEAVPGTDFPPADQQDDRPKLSGSLPESYFDFLARARDPHVGRRKASGYPYHWHYLGQLLGVASPHLQRDGRAHWHRLLSLNDNPMTDFSTLVDTAPLHYMVEGSRKPWTDFDSVLVASVA